MFNFFKSKNPDPSKKAPSPGSAPNVLLKKRRVAVSDLKRGMHVCELDRPWSEASFPFHGFVLQTADDIAALQDQCEYVVIDSLAYDSFSQADQKSNRYLIESGPKTPATKQLAWDFSDADQTHKKAKNTLKTMFSELKLVNQINGVAVRHVVDGYVHSILENPDAMLWFTQLHNKDCQLSQHSLNVCILAIALGKHLGMRDFELNDLGTCGLLHDVGKTSLPTALLQKKGALTDREKQVLNKHTSVGRNLLLSSKSVFSGAADVAFSHHERTDGNGYPRQVDDSKVSYYSKIIAIANSYDNLINSKVFDQLRSSNEALQYIYEVKGSEFDKELVISFIECMGVYPPGTLVEMSSGEVGIVLSNNVSDKARTRIVLILNKSKKPCPRRVINLTQLDGGPKSNPYRIKTALRKRSYGIDVEKFIRAGLQIDSNSQSKFAS